MSLLEKDLEKHSVHDADHAPGIIPDTNDPTAGSGRHLPRVGV